MIKAIIPLLYVFGVLIVLAIAAKFLELLYKALPFAVAAIVLLYLLLVYLRVEMPF